MVMRGVVGGEAHGGTAWRVAIAMRWAWGWAGDARVKLTHARLSVRLELSWFAPCLFQSPVIMIAIAVAEGERASGSSAVWNRHVT